VASWCCWQISSDERAPPHCQGFWPQRATPSPDTGTSKGDTERAGRPRTAEAAAKDYIRRRAKPSVVPGHVKLVFTLDMSRDLAERLSAQAIREGINMEAVILDILGKGVRK